MRFTSMQNADLAVSSGAFDRTDKKLEDLRPLLLDMRAQSVAALR
jgi:hypothetical protein